jgi:hypothetical protein
MSHVEGNNLSGKYSVSKNLGNVYFDAVNIAVWTGSRMGHGILNDDYDLVIVDGGDFVGKHYLSQVETRKRDETVMLVLSLREVVDSIA